MRILRNILCVILASVVFYAVSIVMDGMDRMEMRRISGTYREMNDNTGKRHYVLWQDGSGRVCRASSSNAAVSNRDNIYWNYNPEDSVISVRYEKRKMKAMFTDNDTIEFGKSVVWVNVDTIIKVD